MTPILKLTFIAAACATAFASAPSVAQSTSQERQAQTTQQSPQKSRSQQLAKQDRQAMQRLAETDIAEVKLGELAQDKAQSERVKEYAEHMVEAHGKALEDKKDMADKHNVQLPDEPSKKHKSVMSKLEKLEGAQFDRQYMAEMVKGHQAALKEARKAAKNAKDPQVRQAAQEAAEEIEEHLDRAKSVHASLGGASRGATGEAGGQKQRAQQQKFEK